MLVPDTGRKSQANFICARYKKQVTVNVEQEQQTGDKTLTVSVRKAHRQKTGNQCLREVERSCDYST